MYKSNIKQYFPALVAACCLMGGGIDAIADGGNTKTTVVRVELVHPQAGGAPMRKTPPVPPVTVSGTIRIEIPKQAEPQGVATGRYEVEFFVDDKLVHTTRGDKPVQAGMGSFDWLMDTTAYADGKHKLVVNYWDKNAPSAIGIINLVIRNHGEP
ncbi:MAG: hypothetical protein NTW21_15115 [Verrucomicrobia bacterium]|nr:hypothetical protein [Verrucomicrobiota bacterium]